MLEYFFILIRMKTPYCLYYFIIEGTICISDIKLKKAFKTEL